MLAVQQKQPGMPGLGEKKLAWIDFEHQIVSFVRLERAVCYCDVPESFWPYLLELTRKGFRVQ
ncbi:MAG: hypothetical protein LUD79_05935 [Oscillospiraceae bacterium]|nr:hypothetical protein [Oscillospiraceae bacterium]